MSSFHLVWYFLEPFTLQRLSRLLIFYGWIISHWIIRCIYHNLFMCSSDDGYLGCFHLWLFQVVVIWTFMYMYLFSIILDIHGIAVTFSFLQVSCVGSSSWRGVDPPFRRTWKYRGLANGPLGKSQSHSYTMISFPFFSGHATLLVGSKFPWQRTEPRPLIAKARNPYFTHN